MRQGVDLWTTKDKNGEAAIRDWSPSPSGASSGSQPCGVVARNGASIKAVKWLALGGEGHPPRDTSLQDSVGWAAEKT